MLSFINAAAHGVLLFSLVAPCRGAQQWNYTVKEAHPIPSQWKLVANAPADLTVTVTIALKQGQFDLLEQDLYEVSDPDHPRYGQHLSQQDVINRVQPSNETLSIVHNWLAAHGVELANLNYSPAKDWISAQLPVATLSSLVQTNYSVFQGPKGDVVVRSTSGQWSLPAHLHDHVDLISPTNSFFRPRSRAATTGSSADTQTRRRQLQQPNARDATAVSPDPAVAAVCNTSSVDTLCLRTYYGTINYVPQAAAQNKVALSNYLGESSNRSDTRLFLRQFRPDAVPGADAFRFVSVNGGPTYQSLNASLLAQGIEREGNLEVQTVLGISYPTPLTVYSTAGTPPFQADANNPADGNEPYLDWLNYLLAQPDAALPWSISNSYDDDEQTVPYSYAKRVCEGMAQLGARGVSVFFPSGDSGVGAGGEAACVSNDGRNASSFLPVFPPSCPYVTTVGGTMGFAPDEVAAFDVADAPGRVSFVPGNFSSGGGFSNYFPRPRYQDGVVDAYVRGLGGKYDGLYNAAGRGYPDLAAQAVAVASVWNGSVVHIDGTKCGVATAVFALVNDARLAAGKSPMGFLNPWLYKRGRAAFNDILSGSAVGCGVDGFPAGEGWDAVTGFGSPRFKEILKLLP